MSAVVYRFFDPSGALLYVGQSCDFGKRMASHKCVAPWFGDIASVTLEHFVDDKHARLAERSAIRRERPLYNAQDQLPAGTTLGQQIRRVRTARRFTQWDLANALQIDQATVSNWERGNVTPSPSLVPIIAAALGVDVSDLVGAAA